MWHKPWGTFHPWCICIKTRCVLSNVIADPFFVGKCLFATGLWEYLSFARPNAGAGLAIYLGIRNQESFIRGNLQYMQFTKGYIQYRVIWSYIHLYGLDISIKASRRYHVNHQEKSMSNDEAPCKHSISCIYKNYQSLVISNLIKSFLSDI